MLHKEKGLELWNGLSQCLFIVLALCFLTSATGCAALCAPTLCPRVGGLRNLVGVGVLFDDVIVDDVTLVDVLA